MSTVERSYPDLSAAVIRDLHKERRDFPKENTYFVLFF